MKWVVAPGSGAGCTRSAIAVFSARTLDNPTWTRGTDFGLREYAKSYSWVACDPSNPDRLIVGMKSGREALELGTLSFLQETKDAGKTWTNDLRAVMEILTKHGIPGLLAAGIPSELHQVVIDARTPACSMRPSRPTC